MKAEPMKEEELRKLTTCANCHKKLGETPLPVFWKVKLVRHGLDMKALQRQDGLAAFMGDNAHLASVMGMNEDMTFVLMDGEVMVCDQCATGETVNLMALAEAGT